VITTGWSEQWMVPRLYEEPEKEVDQVITVYVASTVITVVLVVNATVESAFTAQAKAATLPY